jgi:hypothetical protein
MTATSIVSAAVTAGAWVLIPAALFAAAWAVTRGCTWAWRLTAAARQWKRDTRQDPAGSSITDDQIITALTEWGDEQAERDRARDENKQREEGQ